MCDVCVCVCVYVCMCACVRASQMCVCCVLVHNGASIVQYIALLSRHPCLAFGRLKCKPYTQVWACGWVGGWESGWILSPCLYLSFNHPRTHNKQQHHQSNIPKSTYTKHTTPTSRTIRSRSGSSRMRCRDGRKYVEASNRSFFRRRGWRSRLASRRGNLRGTRWVGRASIAHGRLHAVRSGPTRCP